jgi:hypothetical protein
MAADYDDRSQNIERLQESLANAHQIAANWQNRCEAIAKAMTREGIIKTAHDCALQVENLFAVGGFSRSDRLEQIERIFRRAISVASCGEAYWRD